MTFVTTHTVIVCRIPFLFFLAFKLVNTLYFVLSFSDSFKLIKSFSHAYVILVLAEYIPNITRQGKTKIVLFIVIRLEQPHTIDQICFYY